MYKLLNYWFEYCPSNTVLSQLPNLNASFDRWFGGKEDTVQRSIWNSALEEVESWPDTLDGQLARVILYDQIPRGCFRGTAMAFAYDKKALSRANHFLAFTYPYMMDLDSSICLSQIFMALICLSHSEEKAVQHRSLSLSAQFAKEVMQQSWLSEVTKKQLAQVYPEAKQHYDVIKCFGRFPHRNRVLKRKLTTEEKQFLQQKKLPNWMYSQS